MCKQSGGDQPMNDLTAAAQAIEEMESSEAKQVIERCLGVTFPNYDPLGYYGIWRGVSYSRDWVQNVLVPQIRSFPPVVVREELAAGVRELLPAVDPDDLVPELEQHLATVECGVADSMEIQEAMVYLTACLLAREKTMEVWRHNQWADSRAILAYAVTGDWDGEDPTARFLIDDLPRRMKRLTGRRQSRRWANASLAAFARAEGWDVESSRPTWRSCYRTYEDARVELGLPKIEPGKDFSGFAGRVRYALRATPENMQKRAEAK